MSVYSDSAILEAIKNGILGIDPLIPYNVQPASIDLTLDNEIEIIDVNIIDILNTDKKILHENTHKKNIEGGYTLEPGQSVIGYTAERLKFSTFINGKIYNRNSLAKFGLDVASGCYINPGFEGKMPLVIRNLGKVKLIIYPKVRICQLEIHQLTSQSVRNYENRHNLSDIIDHAMQNVPSEQIASQEPLDNSLAEFLHERIVAASKA